MNIQIQAEIVSASDIPVTTGVIEKNKYTNIVNTMLKKYVNSIDRTVTNSDRSETSTSVT